MKSAVTLSLVPEASGGPFVFWNDAEEAIRIAKELGFDAIEIFAPDVATLSALQLSRRLSGLSVAALGTGAGWVKHRLLLCDPDATQRKKGIEFVQSFIYHGSELNAPAIIGSMQGRSGPNLPKLEAIKYLRESLEVLDKAAQSVGKVLLFEPLNRYETDLVNTLAQGAEILRGLNNVKLLADAFHMNIEEACVPSALQTFGSQVGHVHFADSNRCAVGLGHIRWEEMVNALRNAGYAGYLSAEVLSRPSALEAATKTIESFRRLTQVA